MLPCGLHGQVLGSLLAIFGFIVSLRPRGRTRTDVVKLEAWAGQVVFPNRPQETL